VKSLGSMALIQAVFRHSVMAMGESFKDPKELENIYRKRFGALVEYRMDVWEVLVKKFFQQYVRPTDAVLDLGCGYGEFINHISCERKIGLDLNPESPKYLKSDVQFIAQDCSEPWGVPDSSLDVVFSSNFFEHLPDKLALRKTIAEAHRCLKPGGKIIAMGPNIKCVPGSYWDFWDHFLCLTERSMSEALENNGYRVVVERARFLPYSMVNGPRYPLAIIRAYLKLPIAWRIFGKQFLVIAERI